jgi:anti-anti-sigma regulatory factor
MEISLWGNLLVGTLPPAVRVVRFTAPHLDEFGEDESAVEHCELFHELRETVLAGLGKGDTVVLNFGLVESVGPMVERVLLRVREIIRAAHARLVLCRVSPVLLDKVRTLGLFPIRNTEAEAVRDRMEARAFPR